MDERTDLSALKGRKPHGQLTPPRPAPGGHALQEPKLFGASASDKLITGTPSKQVANEAQGDLPMPLLPLCAAPSHSGPF